MTEGAQEPTLADTHDGLLVDLDGTVYRGPEPVPGARSALENSGLAVQYVTNNASRSAAETAGHLAELGFDVTGSDVTTSAQAAVAMAVERVGTGVRTLVVGAQCLRDEATEAGLDVVDSADDEPKVVVQGLSRTLGWPDLAEGCLAIRTGALWIASNVDTTLPTERGLMPGNGSFVAALRAATDREPLVAGKPAAGVLHAAADHLGSRRPLVVGDRIDTDIRGAVAAGMDSLMVLTGVSTVAELVGAGPGSRPTHLDADMSAVGAPECRSRIARDQALVSRISEDGALVVDPGPLTGLALARAVLAAAWEAGADRLRCAERDREALADAGLPVVG